MIFFFFSASRKAFQLACSIEKIEAAQSSRDFFYVAGFQVAERNTAEVRSPEPASRVVIGSSGVFTR
jgi:hypothetical protein